MIFIFKQFFNKCMHISFFSEKGLLFISTIYRTDFFPFLRHARFDSSATTLDLKLIGVHKNFRSSLFSISVPAWHFQEISISPKKLYFEVVRIFYFRSGFTKL